MAIPRAAGAVVGLVLLTACSTANPPQSSTVPTSASAASSTSAGASSTSAGASSTSAPTSSSAAAPLPSAAALKGRHLASLGDSYTAGTRTGPTVASPAAFCAQSAINYPRQVAAALGMTLSDASCNGARTTNVTQPQTFGGQVAPAQLNAVRPDTALVTIALGVNDESLFSTLVGCSRFARDSPGTAPCKDRVLRADDNPVEQIPSVTDRLVADIRAIRARAPGARIVLLGYPKVLPDGEQCPQRWPIATGDAAWLDQSLDRLDEAIRAAADRTGSTFLDLRPVTAEHTACAADPWFNGSSVSGGDGATYHPRSGYMSGVAKALLATFE